jgi:hypothetical protein
VTGHDLRLARGLGLGHAEHLSLGPHRGERRRPAALVPALLLGAPPLAAWNILKLTARAKIRR